MTTATVGLVCPDCGGPVRPDEIVILTADDVHLPEPAPAYRLWPCGHLIDGAVYRLRSLMRITNDYAWEPAAGS